MLNSGLLSELLKSEDFKSNKNLQQLKPIAEQLLSIYQLKDLQTRKRQTSIKSGDSKKETERLLHHFVQVIDVLNHGVSIDTQEESKKNETRNSLRNLINMSYQMGYSILELRELNIKHENIKKLE